MEQSTYAIYYIENGERQECHIDADCIPEALGYFMMSHNNICYNDIIDHMEV